MQSTDLQALAAQDADDLARPHERVLQVDLVDAAHERQIDRAGWPGQVIHRTAAHAQ